MGHLKFLIDLRKPKEEVTETIETLPDLPGLTRHERERMLNNQVLKEEYNRTLRNLRSLAKDHKSERNRTRKSELAQTIRYDKGRMSDLLSKIGAYTNEEAFNGFKEDGDGF